MDNTSKCHRKVQYQIGIASGVLKAAISTCLIKGAKSAIIVCLGDKLVKERCIRDINGPKQLYVTLS